MVDFASITKRTGDLAKIVTSIFEKIGLLNKGSSEMSGMPSSSDVADVGPIASNSLNVTRVGGLTSLVAGVGGSALLLFKVNKTTDRASVVVAAYASVGLIVAAALLTVAVIIAADIRARTAIATAVSPRIRPGAEAVKLVKAAANTGPNYLAALARAYELVLVDAALANVVLTLPSAASAAWQQITIMRQDNAPGRSVTIRPQGQEAIIDHQSPDQREHQHEMAGNGRVRLCSDTKAWLLVPA